MGGNAFPEFKDRIVRLDAGSFMAFQRDALDKLRKMDAKNPRAVYSEIISYKSKPSFGDLDILYTSFRKEGELPAADEFAAALGAVGVMKNGPVTSFAVPVNGNSMFQVDLIRVGYDEFASAFSYFAYNDLGNLLGRVFHRAGFKLGHTGMSFVIRDEKNSSHVAKEVVVTRSWKKALEFAGYDFEKWLEGFDTLEDVFRFVVSSPYFDKRLFALNSLD